MKAAVPPYSSVARATSPTRNASAQVFRDRVFRAGVVVGLGLGGFIDGILLHQILGWHHLICTETCQPNSVAELTRQNTADGWFHLATWLLTIGGVALLYRALVSAKGRPSGRILFGGALAGWGLFNLVEGLIDHQILGIHHVRPESPHWLAYDLLFLASGAALILAGWKIALTHFRSNERSL